MSLRTTWCVLLRKLLTYGSSDSDLNDTEIIVQSKFAKLYITILVHMMSLTEQLNTIMLGIKTRILLAYHLNSWVREIPGLTFVVCMVAPVVMLIFWSGTSSKFIFCKSIARATIASSRANWSPTHFRGPPLKGMNLYQMFWQISSVKLIISWKWKELFLLSIIFVKTELIFSWIEHHNEVD